MNNNEINGEQIEVIDEEVISDIDEKSLKLAKSEATITYEKPIIKEEKEVMKKFDKKDYILIGMITIIIIIMIILIFIILKINSTEVEFIF